MLGLTHFDRDTLRLGLDRCLSNVIESFLGELNLLGLHGEILLKLLTCLAFFLELLRSIKSGKGSCLSIDKSLSQVDLLRSLFDQALSSFGVSLVLIEELILKLASLGGLFSCHLLGGFLSHLRCSLSLSNNASLSVSCSFLESSDFLFVRSIRILLGIELLLSGLLELLKSLLLILN